MISENRIISSMRRCLLAVASCAVLAPVVQAQDITLAQDQLIRLGNGPLIAPNVRGSDRLTLPAILDEDDSNAANLLRSLIARGQSQGFGGLLYDNRDRGHSLIRRDYFPDLTFLSYSKVLRDGGLDMGLAGDILIPAPLVGNSSTALTVGPTARSLPRLAMTRAGGPARAFRTYETNSIYIYPEHRDHDDRDLFPANWPYMITSQGSSYSDRPFIIAVAMTLAAFPRETREALLQANLLAPTVQMILRRNLSLIRTAADYRSAAAHPAVFEAEMLRPDRMIAHAAAMQPAGIPAMIRLRVLEEDFAYSAGLAERSEHLFTTPSAIARLWRGLEWSREMTLSAEATRDPNGRDLTFDWVLLRGDPARVKIETLDPQGTRARVRFNWHPPFVVPPRQASSGTGIVSSRVEIGVFAWNGISESAPAFVTVTYPTHQERVYEARAGSPVRLATIDYDAAARGVYFDPLLFWSAPWADRFSYDEDGQSTGWERAGGAGTRHFDARGHATQGGSVLYEMGKGPDGFPILQERFAQTP